MGDPHLLLKISHSLTANTRNNTKCVKLSIFKLVSAVTRLVPSSGKSSAMSTELTQQVRMLAPPSCRWRGSRSTTTRPCFLLLEEKPRLDFDQRTKQLDWYQFLQVQWSRQQEDQRWKSSCQGFEQDHCSRQSSCDQDDPEYLGSEWLQKGSYESCSEESLCCDKKPKHHGCQTEQVPKKEVRSESHTSSICNNNYCCVLSNCCVWCCCC